jgi:hypothetical protein
MLPLYVTRIEDLGRSDFVKVDCATLPPLRPADAAAPT